MNLGQLLMEIRDLAIYSPHEWEEYIGCFENVQSIFQDLENSPKIFYRSLVERIKSRTGSIMEDVNCAISPKIVDANHLSDPQKRSLMTLGIVSGCYDLLHLGHIRGFVFAKQFLMQYRNPKLCALVLSDQSIRTKKGLSRPVLNMNERLSMLCGVQCLDYVIPLKKPDCLAILEKVRPHYFFKSSTDMRQDIVRKEMGLIESNGGATVLFPCASLSTTALIETVLMR